MRQSGRAVLSISSDNTATYEVDAMTRDHWFDALNRALVRDGPRRAVLSAAGAIAASLAAGGLGAEAAKNGKKKGNRKHKKKGNRKHQKKGNGKGTPKQCGSDIHALCDTAFRAPHTAEEREFCKVKCERCTEAGTAFCIHLPGEDGPERATCCHFADECCGGPIGECCTPDRCCAQSGGDSICINAGEKCCPSDPEGFCSEGFDCCPGKGCAGCDAPAVLNLDTCECECPEGQIACDGACVDGIECPETCASSQDVCCGIPCGDERTCCPDASNTFGGFKCAHLISDQDHCGGCGNGCGAYPRACCNGGCIDTSTNNSHCGTCFFACQGDRVCRPGQSGRGECQTP
jgi:hypothetical protein